MYLIIIFLTLISSLSVGFFGRFFGFYGSALSATSCLILAFLVSVFIFYEVAFIGCFSYIKLTSWMSSETLNVDWGFMFDSITSVLCCVVTFIFYYKFVNHSIKIKLISFFKKHKINFLHLCFNNFLLTAPSELSIYVLDDPLHFFLAACVGGFLIIIAILIKKERKNLSFFVFFVGFMLLHKVLLDKYLVDPILLAYCYLLCLFFIYHLYFTFTRKFFLTIKVVIENYVKSSNYFKLSLWLFFIFLPYLFSNFFFLFYVGPSVMFVLLYKQSYFMLFLFLFEFVWTVLLSFLKNSNTKNACLLKSKFLNIFSREASLYFFDKSKS